jgi:hypothetical protein
VSWDEATPAAGPDPPEVPRFRIAPGYAGPYLLRNVFGAILVLQFMGAGRRGFVAGAAVVCVALALGVEALSVLAHELIHVALQRRYRVQTLGVELTWTCGKTIGWRTPESLPITPAYFLLPWAFTVLLAAAGTAAGLALRAGGHLAGGFEAVGWWLAYVNAGSAVLAFRAGAGRPAGDARQALRLIDRRRKPRQAQRQRQTGTASGA